MTSITFRSSLEGAPEDAWDMSALGDGSVLTWAVSEGTFREEAPFTGEMVDYEFFQLHIAAESGVKANPDSSYWFANYTRLEAIDFNDSFSTEGVVDMRYMFYRCYLEELDLSCFDTSAVETMAGMFCSAISLDRVDLSSFDTRACRDMGRMFMGVDAHWLDLTALRPLLRCESVRDVPGVFVAAGPSDRSGLRSASGRERAKHVFGLCDRRTAGITASRKKGKPGAQNPALLKKDRLQTRQHDRGI